MQKRVNTFVPCRCFFISVGDPDPQDPHVFGPPGSESFSQGSGSGSGSFTFLLKVVTNEKGEAVGEVLTIIC